MIHKTAIIEGNVTLGNNVTIGPYAFLNGDIEIGDNTVIGHCVQIEGSVKVGSGNQILHSSYIGAPPQDVSYDGSISHVAIGDNNILREYVQVHRGTAQDSKTEVGSNCFLMGGVHLAHNVKIGNFVTIANYSVLAGYVEVDDYSFLSGLCAFHQFIRIGKNVMVGGCTGLSKDCPPFMMTVGNPARVVGINVVGLKRNDFDSERRSTIKEAYKIIYRSGKNVSQALEELKKIKDNKDIDDMVEFIEKSERGIVK